MLNVAQNLDANFKPVQEGQHYLTSRFLSPKRLAALRKKEQKLREKAVETIELFKQMYCVQDHDNGGWKCVDTMLERDDRDQIIGLSVRQMAAMIKKGVRL